jgi:hypothetical protein
MTSGNLKNLLISLQVQTIVNLVRKIVHHMWGPQQTSTFCLDFAMKITAIGNSKG